MTSLGEHDAPRRMFSVTPGVREMFTFIVGEILARFPLQMHLELE